MAERQSPQMQREEVRLKEQLAEVPFWHYNDQNQERRKAALGALAEYLQQDAKKWPEVVEYF